MSIDHFRSPRSQGVRPVYLPLCGRLACMGVSERLVETANTPVMDKAFQARSSVALGQARLLVVLLNSSPLVEYRDSLTLHFISPEDGS